MNVNIQGCGAGTPSTATTIKMFRPCAQAGEFVKMKRPSGTAEAGMVTLNVSKEHKIVRTNAIILSRKDHSHTMPTRLQGLVLIMGIKREDLEDGSDMRVRLHSAKTLGNKIVPAAKRWRLNLVQ